MTVKSRVRKLERSVRRHTQPTWAERSDYEAAWKRSNARRRLNALCDVVEKGAGKTLSPAEVVEAVKADPDFEREAKELLAEWHGERPFEFPLDPP